VTDIQSSNTSATDEQLDTVRDVLFGSERARFTEQEDTIESLRRVSKDQSSTIASQNETIAVLNSQVNSLKTVVSRLERIIDQEPERAVVVGEVLVDAVETPKETPGELGSALRTEIEHAINESARQDSVVLAEALYPVMGPAIRRMITSMFTIDNSNPGDVFVVEQVLLIERESGLLLSSAHRDASQADNADVVSGMLDAIRLFVQDAFDKDERDGLQDLRVGDPSVLVEWGPDAVLASVVKGVPDDDYRNNAALTLERIHVDFADELDDFSGDLGDFDDVHPVLGKLRNQGEPPASKKKWVVAALIILIIFEIVLLVIWLYNR